MNEANASAMTAAVRQCNCIMLPYHISKKCWQNLAKTSSNLT